MQEPLIALIERELTDDDLESLKEDRGTKAPALVRLSTRHHQLARSLAEGMSSGDAAIECGYTGARVSILLADPTFVELVTHYKRVVDSAYMDLQKRLASIAVDAAAVLEDRLETDPERFENVELMKIVALGADRTGHGPSSTQNHNHTVGFAARLDAARARIAQRDSVIEAEVVEDPD